MVVITTVQEMKAHVRAVRARGETICLVPTMGYLHKGHLDLMRMGKELFNICEPDVSVFGQKDYQQLAVIRRMVKDLDMNVRVVAHPTVREDDGLAMSSRNKYLSGEQRTNALVLSRALDTARGLVMRGERRASEIRKVAVDMIEATPGALMDYVEIVHPETLRAVDTIDDCAVMALAVRFGPTRLIDNTELQRP